MSVHNEHSIENLQKLITEIFRSISLKTQKTYTRSNYHFQEYNKQLLKKSALAKYGRAYKRRSYQQNDEGKFTGKMQLQKLKKYLIKQQKKQEIETWRNYTVGDDPKTRFYLK